MSFDAIAPHYRWLEIVLAGRRLQDCRLAFLREARAARQVLLLGEGNGRFLIEVLRANPSAHITVLDSSARMLELAGRRLRRCGLAGSRVDFLHRDILAWPDEAAGFDLVASHFFLDCFQPAQIRAIVDRMVTCTRSGARWLISDFRRPERGWQRVRAQIVLQLMYLFFRGVTRLPAARLADPDPFLQADGFALVERKIRHFGLLHSDVWMKTKAVSGAREAPEAVGKKGLLRPRSADRIMESP